jgi:SET domain-containing protein
VWRIQLLSNYKLKVKKSKIHGYGLFADEEIPQDTLIIEYIGEKIINEEKRRREIENYKKGVTYIFYLDGISWIDGEFMGNDSRYVNHSCNPNCNIVWKNGRIYFYSKRLIKKDEELTIDYDYDKDSKKEICNCGSKNCRGFINEV